MNISHPVTAFYVDRMVHALGTTIESEVEEAQKKSKTDRGRAVQAQHVMNRWFRAEGGARYKDPAAGR